MLCQIAATVCRSLGPSFFLFGIGFNLSPTTSQLPVLPAIALATLFGGERGGF